MRQNKILIIITMMTSIVIIALALRSSLLFANGADKVVFVLPKTSSQDSRSGSSSGGGNGGGSILVERICDLTDEGIMLTYSNGYSGSVEAVQDSYEAVIIGTNQYFPLIRPYPVISGRFFSQAQHDYQNRVALLNEKAAFDLFGSSQASGSNCFLGGQPYVVIGVIQDADDKNRNIYIPGTCISEQAGMIMAKADNTAALMEIKAQLNRIGINETRYDFVSVSGLISIITGNITFIPLYLIVCILAAAIRIIICKLRRSWVSITQELKQQYFVDLFQQRNRSALRIIMLPCAIILIAIIILLCIPSLLTHILRFYNTTDTAWNILQAGMSTYAGSGAGMLADTFAVSVCYCLSALLLPILGVESVALTIGLCRSEIP